MWPPDPNQNALSPMADQTTATTQFRRPTAARKKAASSPPPARPSDTAVEKVDTSFLESLVGYNARRAALSVIAVFLDRMAPFGLRVVDFSVLTLIAHNPGITSRQLCAALDILPPNLVGMIKDMEKQGWVEKREHPTDRRAQGLHLTEQGQRLQGEAQAVVASLESEAITHLTESERATLLRLLQKVYRPRG
jgi:DNA-binding MarR family transcriptional regulator